ncbi:ankyrin repeat domain-containing protein [Synechococcus sp. Nb3U1]|uniref:ankyrin repeat domain-containing protein n=1 Tax=Synechococcus sp. Nb3U1 TaxID=1914529 RepID=UPI001F428DDB|nr:ankyrin repeat domain-containing protein [Synechococcus sp. Nb3U1]MCF2969609.1 ankyrin repeat domain-containing protein [Synechococcus sp. Nb3U1]
MRRRFLGIGIGLGSLLVAGLFYYGHTLSEDPEAFAKTNPLRLQLALWLGKDAHVVDVRGKTALFFVDSGLNTRLLLRHGVDPNQLDYGGASPLHQAARMGNSEVTKVLLQGGAEVNVHFGGGGIPLHFAAWSGNPEVVQLLLEHGSEIDERDGYGLTPLNIAQDLRRWEAAILLSRWPRSALTE